tara:strand:+ start:928 stop:1455 length:528 start_codon:yes stop_codon:yes gene_type:complete
MKLLKDLMSSANGFTSREGLFSVIPFLLVLVAVNPYRFFMEGIESSFGMVHSLLVLTALLILAYTFLHQRKSFAEVCSVLIFACFAAIALTLWVPVVLILSFALAWFFAVECHNGRMEDRVFSKNWAMVIPVLSLLPGIIKFDYMADFVIYWFIGMLVCLAINVKRKPRGFSKIR